MTRTRLRSESPDDCRKLYCQFYRNQIGGALPVFRGADQYGDGLGDILKGVFRFLLPIATSAASKLEALARHRGMQSADQNVHVWKPEKIADQTGKGRKSRKRRRTPSTKGKRKPRKSPKKPTSRKRKRVYKRKASASKRIRILPTNF